MLVVNVRKVRMTVFQLGVLVHMGGGFYAVPIEIVAVLVVRIVAVAMAVGLLGVFVHMLMSLGQVQPNPGRHQGGGEPENRMDRLAKHTDSQRSTDKWRRRKIRASARRAQAA